MPKKAKPKTHHTFSFSPYLFYFLLFFFFFALRFLHLTEAFGFGSDAGRDFLTVWNLYHDKHLTLLGPPSQYMIYGHQFYFGPAPYAIILPALLIGQWQALSVGYFLIVLNALSLLACLLVLHKYTKQKLAIYLFALFATFTPLLIEYSRSYWNPYLLLPFSYLLLSLLLLIKNKYSLPVFLGIGLLFGIGLQTHYSFILTIILSMIWIISKKKLTIQTLILLCLGFVLGFAPILIFELRNNFYNTQTLLLFLTHSSGNTRIDLNFYYVISLIPFFLLLLSILFAKLNKVVIIFLMGFLILSSVIIAIPTPTHGFGMIAGWNYLGLEKMAQIITTDNPTNFNIVDQLTNDNRAMALRYVVTSRGVAPQSVSDYPKSHTLYIYSNQPLTSLLMHPIWEMQSSLPLTMSNTWQIQNGVFLYKVNK